MRPITALIALRFRLLLARTRVRVGHAIFQALFFLFIMAGALGVYFALVIAFRALPRAMATEALYLSLTVIWWVWIVFPLLGMSFDDSADLSKLHFYPVTPAQMTTGVLLSDLASSPAGFTVLLAVPVGWATQAGDAAMMAVAVGLLAAHMAALVESLRIVLWDLLRSRRTRDLVMLLSPLVGVLFYAMYGMFFRPGVVGNWAGWLNLHPSRYLRFMPSGLVVGVVTNASAGRYWAAGGYLAGLGALAAATVAAMALLVRRVQSGETEVGGRARRQRRRPTGEGAGPTFERALARRRIWLPVSEEIATVARKELLLFWRNPHLKTHLIQAIAMPILWLMFIGVRSFGGGYGQTPAPGLLLGTIAMMLFGSFSLCANMFGIEGNAVSTLFLFPTPRRVVLAGKNAALYLALMVVYVPALVILAALSRQWSQLPLALLGTATVLALALAVGNFLSIYAPYRLPTRRKNPLASASYGPGCLGFILVFVGYVAVAVLAIPMAAALGLPMMLHAPLWYAVGAPAAAAYAWWMYRMLLDAAAARLLTREPEIIEAVGAAAGE